MNPTDLVTTLVSIDQIETWKQMTPQLTKAQRLEAYAIAEPIWLKRQAAQNKLYVNLEELDKLEDNDWIANTYQKQLIWASVLGTIDSKTERHRFQVIKEALIKKYGKQWWYDCDRRVKPAYSARMQILKKTIESSSIMHRSMTISHASMEVARDILSRIPA